MLLHIILGSAAFWPVRLRGCSSCSFSASTAVTTASG